MKKTLSVILALVLCFTALVPFAMAEGDTVAVAGEYVFKDSVSTLSTSWNRLNYETSDQSYPLDFITDGLYSFYFNDDLHPVEGKNPYEGYVILPEMAAEMPVDVTLEMKAKNDNMYGIPESAEAGYAYVIDLNKDATWEDGTPITAETWVYSMKMMLDPKMNNYRASDYINGDFVIANAADYFYQGQVSYTDNGLGNGYTIDDLTLGEDGVYYTAGGNKMYIGVGFGLEWMSGYDLNTYVGAYGDSYFGMDHWEELSALQDENGLVPLTEETNAWLSVLTTANPNWGETDADLFNYYVEEIAYADGYDFANVGIFASDEYQLTIVFAKSLAGFNLMYNLSGSWLVYQPLYEASIKTAEGTDALVSDYCTSVETTMSYGPYKLTEYQTDKYMRFERNENWFGYKDGKHVYVDPVDGETYPMYQTTSIYTLKVEEASTRKLMFLNGELMGYGLQSEDFDKYRNSEYCYATPSETIYFFIFNGYLDAIQNREANEGFDKEKYDIETITLTSFRKAIAVTYDKEALCTAVSPSRSGGYGLIGNLYIYDPDTGARYRDTVPAKKALCDFYSVDVDAFATLDEAVDSITGYDPIKAKELFTEAFNESLEKGYITSADGLTSDQTIRIEYSSSSHSDFIEKTLNYLNEKLADVLVGTPFEGKIEFYESAPKGDNWSTDIKSGMSDTVLGGWSGSALNPFSIMDCYTNPSRQYDAKWFDASKVDMTLTIDGEELTTDVKSWSEALNGSTIKIGGNEYCFGDGKADIETRLEILAALEAKILMTYDYIPMLQNASMALLSKQVFYVVEEYNPIMGRGGITYMKYNYDEAEWAEYVAANKTADGLPY